MGLFKVLKDRINTINKKLFSMKLQDMDFDKHERLSNNIRSYTH